MKVLLWLVSSLVLAGALFLSVLLVIYLQLPDVNEITKCPKVAVSGRTLCPTSKNYVRLENISDHLKQAVLLSEDAAFYTHQGFDWRELKNSFLTNLEEGGYVRGGSTITQQLAKNVWLSGEKSLTRKLTEAFLAKRLEEKLSKKQILEFYLNAIEWGRNIYGIKEASAHYFGKPASQLTPAESAYLAFLLPNPKSYSKSQFPGGLSAFGNKRVREILGRMRRYNRISEEQYLRARQQLGDEVGLPTVDQPSEGQKDWVERQGEEEPESYSPYDSYEAEDSEMEEVPVDDPLENSERISESDEALVGPESDPEKPADSEDLDTEAL